MIRGVSVRMQGAVRARGGMKDCVSSEGDMLCQNPRLTLGVELIHLEIHRVVGLAYTHRAAHNVEREVQVAFWGSLIRGPRE